MVNELSLVRAVRERTWLDGDDRHWPRLADPQWQMDFVVDGVSVADRVRLLSPNTWGTTPGVSVADSASPGYSATAVLVLAGSVEREQEWDSLAEGRVALYVCALCGDLGCGAVTVAVERLESVGADPVVRWADIRVEDTFTPAAEMPDLSAIGPFSFDAARYGDVLAGVVRELHGLADEERAAEADWRRHHTMAGRMRQLFNR